MIRAKFSRVREGLQLEMKDHATGSPLVCAGASAIVWALAGWLHNHPETEAVLDLRSGNAFVQCARTPEAEAAFELAEVGLRQLEKKYQTLINVEEVIG